jgi:FKBP-type peptidyl-prolyl cis-trans isomerase FkpA
MSKLRILLVLFLVASAFAGCKKDSYDADKQAAIDETLIVNYLAKNNIVATRHSSGVYYQIIAPGAGAIEYTSSTSILAHYQGMLLDGTIFDTTTGKSPVSFILGQVIAGWQIGIPMIQKGGKIRLIIPSVLGYQNQNKGTIPPNSVMDFEIELINVQ